MALSGWNINKRVNVKPGSGLVPSTLTDFTCPMLFSDAAGLTTYDLSPIFDALGANYAKIALEVGSTGVQVPIQLRAADWDDTSETATIYPTFASLADGNVFYLYWDEAHRDNVPLTLSDYGDDFSTFDEDKWSYSHTDETEPVVFYDETNQRILFSGSYTSTRYGSVRTDDGKLWVDGDFDIQVDYNVDLLDCTANSNPVAFALSGDGLSFSISRYRTSSSNKFWASINGSGAGVGSAINSGKFRITRSSTSVYIYYWNGSSWSLARSLSSSSYLGPVFIILYANQVADCPIQGWMDNVVINSADSVYGTWVDKNEGFITVVETAPSAPGSGDELTVWNLAAADDLWEFASAGILSLRVGLAMPFPLRDIYRTGLAMPFRLTDYFRIGLNMPFGAVLRMGLNMPFGATTPYRLGLNIPISYARPHRLGLNMPIEYTSTLRAGLAMPFPLMQSHRFGIKMPFGMVETIRSGLSMPFELAERDTLRTGLRLPFGFEPDAGGVYSDAVSITRDSDGAEISAHYIRTKYHRDDSYIDGELRVSRQDDFLKCPRGTLLTISYNGETEHVMVDHAYRQRPELTDGSYQVEYIVSLTSASEKLDAPWARPLLTVLGPGMASAIATALAAAEGVTLTWSMIDEFIPADTLYANNETPAAVIKKLAAAWGGCLQTEPDGTVEVVPYYPTSVHRWAGATPDLYLSDYDNVNSMSETPDPRPGYNSVRVMDTLTPQASATLDYEVVSATEQIIRRRKVPYSAAETVTLSCSRPDRVTIEPLGLQVERIDEELVAIEAGSGSTRYPIYAVLDKEYGDIQLGTITHSEDGTIQTEVTGQSLALITYTTRAISWRVRSDILDNVQFWSEVE